MIKFAAPVFLWALPLAATLLFLLLRRSRATLSPRRRAAGWGARFLIIGLLLAAMAQPSYSRLEDRAKEVVFLLDVSDSVSPEALEEGIRRMEDLSQGAVREGRRTALILFAGRAEVVRPLSPDPLRASDVPIRANDSEGRFDRRRSLDPARTDYRRALRLAETLSQGDTQYVVLSDGLDPLGTFPIPRPPGVRLVVAAGPRRDVAVVGVRAPPAVRTGEAFDVRVDLFSASPAEVEVALRVGNQRAGEKRVALPAGRSLVVFRHLQIPLPGGSHPVAAIVRAEGDREPRNNLAESSLFVLGKPQVLLIEDNPSAGDPLARILRAHDFEVRRISPARLAKETLADYDTVIAAGVRGTDFSGEAARRLRNYVTDGGGFWLIAPPDPRAAEGYARSALSEFLPVTFTPEPIARSAPRGSGPRKTRKPSLKPRKGPSATVALLLVVDKSGSMAGEKLDLVKEACRATADTLVSGDSIGVLAFDMRPRWVLKFASPDRKKYIQDQIYRLFADGGTDIYPALVEAYRAMSTDPRARRAGIRHVVLLSDGDTYAADFRSVVTRMAQDGITVSTVCILQGKFDPILMNEIATLGGGRFRSTGSFSSIPKIFTDEARALVKGARGSDVPPEGPDKEEKRSHPPTGAKQEKILPQVREEHEILGANPPKKLPPLSGILAAVPRRGVRTPIATADGKAVLSIGRIGLGKAAVWTSDLSGTWSGEWLRWTPTAPKLFAHLVRHLAGASEDLDLSSRVEVRTDRREGRIRIVPGRAGERITLTRVAPGRGSLPLTSDSDGSLLAHVPLEEEPTLVRLTREAAGRTEHLTLRLVRGYEDEFLPGRPHRGTTMEAARADFRREARKENRDRSLVFWLLLAAVCILPLDVALRRWA